jgi:hypothetical protein
MLSADSGIRIRVPIKPIFGLPAAMIRRGCALLPVTFQDLVARGRYLGPILLQARQNDEITLIDHGTAEALDIAVAGLLLLRRATTLLLGNCAG